MAEPFFEIWPKVLEANLQNLAVVADEPSGCGIRKSDRPITAHLRQFDPGLPFIRTPGGSAGGEVRLSLCRDHNTAVVFMAEVVSMPPIIAVFSAAHIRQTEDRSWNRRLGRKLPALPAIIRGGHLGSAVVGQVAAAHDPMPGIAKRYRESTRIRVAHQRSVIRIPRLASIPSRQNPGDARPPRSNPRVLPALCRNARTTR
jgi:hypothetical protein